MATEVILPKWGLTMEDGTIVTWQKSVGDTVAEGDVLAEVETEKVETDLESPCAGVLARILVEEDETVDVGTVVAVIAADSAEAASLG